MKYKSKSSDETMLIADKYTKFYNFDDLYKSFKDYIEKLNFKKNDNYDLCYDKYLLAAVVGCIEGNIKIDTTNSSWYIWFGQYHASYKVDSNKKFPYILLSIYEFIKNHVEYYNFIIKYYNLWHRVPKYENPEFYYDEFHILDMQDNYKQLMCTMYKDIKNAGNNLDNYVIFSYEALYNALVNLFDKSKIHG
nr:hypothetical protein [Sedimentibacter sp.]